MKKISVGIPLYNQEAFIEKTIVSVLNQTVKPYEIVVSSNYSTDNSDKILEKYKDRIRIVRPPHFLSSTDNYQFLADNIRGDWYVHIDSDDFLEPNAIEEISKYVDDDKAVLIKYGFNLVDENNKLIKKNVMIDSAWKRTSFPHNFYESLSSSKVSNWARCIRMDAFRAAGGYEKCVAMSGDWCLWLKLSPFGDFLYIPKALSDYRVFNAVPKGIKRIDMETDDQAYIVNTIQKGIIEKYNLDSSLWKITRRIVAKNRYIFHKKNNHPFDIKKWEINEKQLIVPKILHFVVKFRECVIKR